MSGKDRWFIKIVNNIADGNEIVARVYTDVFFLVGVSDGSYNRKMEGKNLWEVPTDASARFTDIIKMIEEASRKYGFKIATYRKRGGGNWKIGNFLFPKVQKQEEAPSTKKLRTNLIRENQGADITQYKKITLIQKTRTAITKKATSFFLLVLFLKPKTPLRGVLLKFLR